MHTDTAPPRHCHTLSHPETLSCHPMVLGCAVQPPARVLSFCCTPLCLHYAFQQKWTEGVSTMTVAPVADCHPMVPGCAELVGSSTRRFCRRSPLTRRCVRESACMQHATSICKHTYLGSIRMLGTPTERVVQTLRDRVYLHVARPQYVQAHLTDGDDYCSFDPRWALTYGFKPSSTLARCNT